jgi:hypothetical protein
MLKKGSIFLSKNLYRLVLGGGVAFWVTTIVTSLLPIAAEYRAAYSNWSIQTVWVDSLIAGLIIAGCVSYSLLRSFDKIPTRNPILKSMILSSIALVIATVLIDVPRSVLEPKAGLYYFLVGLIFNAARFLVLGSVIGNLYQRLYGQTNIARTFKEGK